MRNITYFAVFEPSTNGTFGVYFPDLSGCVSMGDNFEHAQIMAAEALGLHLWGMEKDNDTIPPPTDPPFADISEGSIIAPVVVFPDIVKMIVVCVEKIYNLHMLIRNRSCGGCALSSIRA